MRYKTVLKIIEVFLFLIASITFMYFVNFFVVDLGSGFSLAVKFLPFYLSSLMPVYLLIVFHLLINPSSFKRKKLCLLVNGPIICVLSFTIIILVSIYVGNGTYSSFIYGNITRIYPLDSFIVAILELIFGALLITRGISYKEDNGDMYQLLAKKRYNRVIKSIFRSLYILIVLFFAGNLLMLFNTFDISFKNFGADLSVYILMIVPIIQIIFYIFVFKSKEDGAEKKLLISKLSYVSLGLSSVGAIWFLIAKLVAPNFMSSSLVALFPIDYMSSIAVGPILLIVINFVPPIVAIFHFLHPEKEPKTLTKVEEEDKKSV